MQALKYAFSLWKNKSQPYNAASNLLRRCSRHLTFLKLDFDVHYAYMQTS